MIVAPGPVGFLVVLGQMAKFDVRIMMSLDDPLVVVGNLIVVPDVIIVVIGIVNAVVVRMAAGDAENRKHHGCGQESRRKPTTVLLHAKVPQIVERLLALVF